MRKKTHFENNARDAVARILENKWRVYKASKEYKILRPSALKERDDITAG
jgi:hypothetical protein